MKSTLLGTSILASVLCFAVLPAHAQTAVSGSPASQQTEDQPSEIDEVVVTGSRLRRERFDNPTPVLTVSEEEFEKTAVGNAIDVIEDIPLVGAGSNSRGANTQFGDNFAFADLFNLGTQRTLTLVNGRRFISGNQNSVFVPDNATGAQVDITSLPPSLIQRVEVTPLTGGAIYGADAVGGVINFVLKDDFEGLDVLTQYGITDYGDGQRYRGAVTWGTNFYNDQANITLALDYFKQELIPIGGDRDYTINPGGILNPRNSQIRRDGTFGDPRAPASVFLPGNEDFQPGAIFARDLTNGSFSAGGLLMTGNSFQLGASNNSFFIPQTAVAAALAGRDAEGFTVFAPTSLPAGITAESVILRFAPGTNPATLTAAQRNALAVNLLQRNRPTPQEYFAANPGVSPLLFIGTFYGAQGAGAGSPLGFLPTIRNTDPATSALFPRIAVPLQFNSSGTLVPFNIGDPALGTLGTGVGGDGFSNAARGYGNLQSSTERASFSALTRFDITPSITYKGEYLYSDIQYRSIGAANSNAPAGSTTAGNRNIPVYIDQNPFFASNLPAINALVAQGLTIPTLNGQRVLYVGRALADIAGPTRSGNDVQLFRTAQSLEGQFGLWDRRFYWDAAYVYGQNDIENFGTAILDHEFAMAVDVVTGPNGQPVCRQQTLANPESIANRDPSLANIATLVGLVPSRDAVAACIPFSIFGENNATVTDALRDNLLGDTGSANEGRQHYLAASLGGEIFRLPGGWISAGAQIEWRNESLRFTPNRDAALGLGRSAVIPGSFGETRFLEYGYEVSIPIFGEGFNFPLFEALELSGAYRIVDRDGRTTTAGVADSPGTTDDVYQASLRWQVSQDLQFRANKSTSVRSASITELFGSPQSAFTGANLIPCSTTTIGQGPAPAIRRENCIQAAILTGAASNRAEAETFLASYVSVAGTRPAAVTGNPFLSNEESEAFGYGVTFTPRWIPRLTLAADYYDAEITNQVGLVGPNTTTNACFDSADFPGSLLNGTPACDLFQIGVRGPDGNFINPVNSPLTGRPASPVTNPGAPSVVNQPFQASWFAFSNLNLASTRLRALTLEARYNFSIEEAFGAWASNWGDIFLSGSAYQLQQYDVSPSGTFLDTNKQAGEGGFADWEFRGDINHRMGRFDHRLTMLYASGTVANIQTNRATFPEQTDGFELDGVLFANYTAAYELRDNINIRMTVNNLFNTRGPREDIGIVSDAVGRSYLFTLSGSF
ncbi:TonB-dependent siderophore receptor [Brevundimonas sp.]|uniref:TonB-dependent receptor plug domain-containing protein n=1 Tax=Brevundimonas sp. TaxID=1871086 RepID=UPI00272FA94E|nr:TonB-dependent receptor [Brevundimonas sp.]MDP1913459.1 TonB-dependent receptor [Brevundimonas sp.]